MKQIVLSILVENTPGVLSRVSGLFTRRGYNIDSITDTEREVHPDDDCGKRRRYDSSSD